MPKKNKKRNRQAPQNAFWEPDTSGPVTKARCSACGFTVEPVRAVETGWASTEFTGVKYRYCPMCGKPMAVRRNALPEGLEA